MGEIIALKEEHIGEVSDLFLRIMRGQRRPGTPGLHQYFRDIFFENPWVTPDICSLVYVEKGKVMGFAGVLNRPMEYQGKPIRAASIGPLCVDREAFTGSAIFELFRHLFRGPQDFTFTDGAAEDASAVWTASGAQVARIQSFHWIRILRPFRAGSGLLDRLGGAPSGFVKSAFLMAARPADWLAAKIGLGFGRPRSRYTAKVATAAELLACMQGFRGREALKPRYNLPEFEWLMAKAATATGHGRLRMVTVHSPDGDPCGSFVYYVKPPGTSYVLQVGCRRRDYFPGVLSALFADAWEQGASSLKGQAIAGFLPVFSQQQCLFRQLNSAVVGHSRNPEIMKSFLLGDSAISRLDGECWFRFPTDPWL